MNTALNFVSMPKDSASSVVSGDLSPDKPGQMAIDSANKRQDLADGGEKNASFANVLKEESHQERGQKGTEGKSDQSENTDNKVVDAKTAKTREADTAELAESTTAADEQAIEVSNREPNSTGEIILSEIKTHIQPPLQVSTASSSNLRSSVAEASASKINSNGIAVTEEAVDQGEETSAPTLTNLNTLTSDAKNSGASSSESASTEQPTNEAIIAGTSASASAEINSDKIANVAESALKADRLPQSPIATTLQVSTSSSTQTTAQGGNSEEAQPGRPVALTAEQLRAKATIQQSSNEIVKQAASGTQPAVQGEEALATAASSELKEAQTKTNSISVSASLESLPAAGKPLPNSGKNLPAGLFFQGEGEAPVVSRAEQATQPIDLNTALAAKANPAAQQNPDKGIELSGNKFMSNLLSAASATPEATAPSASAPLSTDNATNTPPVLNPLLQVTADKSLQAARSPLAGGTESALNLNITAQAGSAEWQSQLSGRIRWMGSLNISSAELKLHPAELGAMEIKISTEDDQTRISFVTNNAAAKEVIESTLPRLREMLGEGGLNLEQGDVAQRDLSEEKQAHEALNRGNQTDTEDGEEAELQQANLHIKRNSTSQIDHYV